LTQFGVVIVFVPFSGCYRDEAKKKRRRMVAYIHGWQIGSTLLGEDPLHNRYIACAEHAYAGRA